jgi:hypothetical protein
VNDKENIQGGGILLPLPFFGSRIFGIVFKEEKMKCDRCECQIKNGEESHHLGQVLCEDCYMDALSPVKPCDPWAVYTAKSMSGDDSVFTEIQKKIMSVLKKTKGMEPEALAEELGIRPDALQREIATLRHMEKIGAVMEGGRKVFRIKE